MSLLTEEELAQLPPLPDDVILYTATNPTGSTVNLFNLSPFRNHRPRTRRSFQGYTPKPAKVYLVRANTPKSERRRDPGPVRAPLTPAGIELLGHAPRPRKRR